MTGRKADEDLIRSILKERQAGLSPARKWWPKYLFRFDHIEAVAAILNSGRLLSRRIANETGALVRDCASAEIIADTADEYQQCVRLYFRPKTPMQHSSEGVRPAGSIQRHAHCPVPVVMLFDAMEVLGRDTTRFSDGNLRVGQAKVGSDAPFFEKIPFDLVYHDGWMAEDEKKEIKFRRHAEVIVPDELDLAPLKYVVCRSQAEQETLVYLIDASAREHWSKVTLTKTALHNRTWNFVEQVDLVQDRLIFRFNRSYSASGPFRAVARIEGLGSGASYSWRDESYLIPEGAVQTLRVATVEPRVVVELRLDDAIVYKNELSQASEPV